MLWTLHIAIWKCDSHHNCASFLPKVRARHSYFAAGIFFLLTLSPSLFYSSLFYNEIVPQPLRNCNHQAKPKKAASGAHPKRQSPSRFCVQAIAGVQPQKSRNVAFGTPKNNENVLLLEPLKTMKSCPSHCETAATRQSPRKLRRERIRKTLRLEPLKTMKSCPSHCETSATRQSLRKLRRRNTLLGALPLSEGSAEKEKAKQRSQWGNGVGAMQLGYAETMRNNVAYETQ